MRGRLINFLVTTVAIAFLCGCGNYQLGTQAKVDFQSIYIEPVENTANLPQAVALFGTQLREAFLKDGRLTVATSPSAADVILKVDLYNYTRRSATVRRNDTGLARSFDLELEARCTLRDRRDGKILFADRPVNVTREVFTSDGTFERNAAGDQIFVSRQLQAEYQTHPIIASTLAERIAHAVLDVW